MKKSIYCLLILMILILQFNITNYASDDESLYNKTTFTYNKKKYELDLHHLNNLCLKEFDTSKYFLEYRSDTGDKLRLYVDIGNKVKATFTQIKDGKEDTKWAYDLKIDFSKISENEYIGTFSCDFGNIFSFGKYKIADGKFHFKITDDMFENTGRTTTASVVPYSEEDLVEQDIDGEEAGVELSAKIREYDVLKLSGAVKETKAETKAVEEIKTPKEEQIDKTKNTLTVDHYGATHTFYLGEAKLDEERLIAHFFEIENGQPGDRLSMYCYFSGKFDMIYVKNGNANPYIDSGTSIKFSKNGVDGVYEGSFAAKEKRYGDLTDGKFSLTCGNVHPYLEGKELFPNRDKKNTGNNSKPSNSKASNYDSDLGRDCTYCDGLGNCDKCWGEGYIDCDKCADGRCMNCGGSGFVKVYTGLDVRGRVCVYCNGVGLCKTCDGLGTKECAKCNGSGLCKFCVGGVIY